MSFDATPILQRIYARCEEVGACLEWTGARSAGGGMYVSFEGKKYPIRRFLWTQKHGPIPEGRLITSTCNNPRCVRHLACITASKRNQRTAAAGWYRSPAQRAKVSAGRAKNSKLSDHAVAEIRAWEGRVPEIAAAHGISEAYAYMLRRGQFRKAPGNPFSGLMG